MCSFLIKECRLSLFIDAIYDMLTDGRVILGEPTGTGSCCPLKPGRTAGCLPYNGCSGNWNHYVWHGQRVLSRVQIFCRTSLPWCHQWTGAAAALQENLELRPSLWKQ